MQPGVPVREQLGHVLIEINQYLGAVISASITLRAACIESNLPEPTPSQLRDAARRLADSGRARRAC